MNYEKMHELLKEKNYGLLKEELTKGQIADVAEFIEELEAKDSLLVFKLLPKETAAETFSFLPIEDQSKLSGLVNEEELLDILEELSFDDKIDLLEEMPANAVKRILKDAPETERKLINHFLNYPEDSAGSIMTIEFVDLKKEMPVKEALKRIRDVALEKETIYTSYVIDSSRHLEGIVSLRDLVIASPDEKIEEIMTKKMIAVNTSDDKEHVAELIQKYDLLAIPVIDNEGRLVGIITIDDIIDVIEQETTEDFHKMATVGKMNVNLLDASPWFMVKKRLPWLMILIFMNIFSGAGIAYFEDTIQAVVALVFFLPLLIDSGGNAGAQSATLMIRSLAIGDVKVKDWFKLLRKEFVIAVALGLLMGAAVSVIGIIRGGPDVAVVVASSMVLMVIVGSTIGMSLPFLFSKFDIDPATASGPLVTSISDIVGVLIYFSIATWYLGIG